MNIDTDKIKKIYDELIQHVKDDGKEEFYKKAAEMAISMGISRQQWEEDRKRMEKMENLILEELEPEMPAGRGYGSENSQCTETNFGHLSS